MYTQIDEQTIEALVRSDRKITPLEAFKYCKAMWSNGQFVDSSIATIARKLPYAKKIRRALDQHKCSKSKHNSRLTKLTAQERETKRIIKANEDYYNEWYPSDLDTSSDWDADDERWNLLGADPYGIDSDFVDKNLSDFGF